MLNVVFLLFYLLWITHTKQAEGRFLYRCSEFKCQSAGFLAQNSWTALPVSIIVSLYACRSASPESLSAHIVHIDTKTVTIAKTGARLSVACLPVHSLATSVYSYFEKGWGKKCTRQCRKALWIVLSSQFFNEIWKNGTRGLVRMFGSTKGKRNNVLIISHYPSWLSRARQFFRQPFSKQLYTLNVKLKSRNAAGLCLEELHAINDTLGKHLEYENTRKRLCLFFQSYHSKKKSPQNILSRCLTGLYRQVRPCTEFMSK